MERLTGLDATFLYLETPTAHMHVAMTAIVDTSSMPEGYSFERFRDHIVSRFSRVPAFRRRLVEVPFQLHHPVWIEDPNFDIDYHVRRVAVPSPGGRRELADLAAQIASIPLHRDRPLWEVWVIEGLKQGRLAMVSKVHHAAIDGASGAEVMTELFDIEALPYDEPIEQTQPSEDVPSDLALMSYAMASKAKRSASLLTLIGQTAQSVANVVANRRDPEGQTGAAPLSAPRTPWSGAISPGRRVAFGRIPLGEVKQIKSALDATVNDVILAVCSGALRRYLEAHDVLPDEPLVAVCPVSVRTADEVGTGGNKVSGMFVSLASNVADPLIRVAAIAESTIGAKQEHNAVGARMLTEWGEYAAPRTFGLASRLYSSMGIADRHRPIHNLIISNVPGPPFQLYLAGAEVIATYPMGPIMEGCGLNVTVLSYRDSIDFGFMADREMVPDIWEMPRYIDEAFMELKEVVLGTQATSAPKQQAPAKKAPVKKAPAKKAPAKKAPAKKQARTRKTTA